MAFSRQNWYHQTASGFYLEKKQDILHTRAMWPCQMSDKSWLFVGANLSASTSLEWWTLFSPMVKMPQLMTQRGCFLKGKNLLKKSHCFGTSPLDSTCFSFWKAWQLSTICCGVSSCLFTHLTSVGAWHYHLGEECGRDLQGYQGVSSDVLKSSFSPEKILQGSLNGTHIRWIKQYKSMVILRDFLYNSQVFGLII